MSDPSGRYAVSGRWPSPRRRRNRSETFADLLTKRLVPLEEAMGELTQAQAESRAMLDGVVDRLDKQVVRAGRELFKANALAEAQQSTVEAALEQLKNAEAHRERELAELRDRVGEARDAGRVDLVQRVLPALDGLEEAIGSGQRLMEREAARVNSVPSIWERLNPAGRRSRASEASSREAIAAWVAGLVFVRERLLDALAAVDVVPIIAEGRPFDPHRHVAVETVLASGTARPGAVVREHRRGYVRGSVILRYAEVVVARTEMEISR